MAAPQGKLAALRSLEKTACPKYSSCLDRAARQDCYAVPCKDCDGEPGWFSTAAQKKLMREADWKYFLVAKIPQWCPDWSEEIRAKWFEMVVAVFELCKDKPAHEAEGEGE
jgi:hypothetical protein